MTIPIIVDIPANTWTKVNASPVQLMTIHRRMKPTTTYFHAYWDAGGSPTDEQLDDIAIQWRTLQLEFSNTVDSDFYLLCRDNDGKVRIEV